MHLFPVALAFAFISSTCALPTAHESNEAVRVYSRSNVTIQPNPANGRWVSSWTSMVQLTEPQNLPPAPFNQTGLVFANSTIRQTIRLTLPAQQIRLRFSNAFGGSDLPITKATVALPRAYGSQNLTGSSGIETETVQTLTFSGDESIIVPQSALAVSDPLDFPVKADEILSITLYLREGQTTNEITSHPGSRAVIWMAEGDYTTAANISAPSTQSVQHWYYLSAVEAWQARDSRSLVVVGDSITDGRGAFVNTNGQWPNYLSTRLQRSNDSGLTTIGVVNQAAGGNRVLADGLGPNAASRIDRDVLAQSGVGYALVFEGVNDIGTAAADNMNQTIVGDRLIQAYKQIITRVHAQSIPVFGGTITPFGCFDSAVQPYSDPVREETRLRVNDWIRTSGWFDAVVDFDEILRDPYNNTQLAPYFSSGDCLHPNPAGYLEMAAKFPVDIFAEFAEGVSGFT